MGASWRLQCEIDHVLKKVQDGVHAFDSICNKVYDTDNANFREKHIKVIRKLVRYRDQIRTWLLSTDIKDMKVSLALMEGRKLIENEMERYKIHEKETKVKAFSTVGLSQEPKMDLKDQAKSETRDWLNSMVNELENQIDSFEAEMEELSVKKGKTRPHRVTHLETSIARHKAHVMKLELILRLLHNDELSPEQVNAVKNFLEDSLDRNQDGFEEFTDGDELYSSLPLDKEFLEDLGSRASRAVVGRKPSAGGTLAKSPATASTSIPHVSAHHIVDESTLQNTYSDLVARKPLYESSAPSLSEPQTPPATRTSPVAVKSSTLGIFSEYVEEKTNFIGQRSSPALSKLRLRAWAGLPGQPSPTITVPPGSEKYIFHSLATSLKAGDGHGSSNNGYLVDAATLECSIFSSSSASPLQQQRDVQLSSMGAEAGLTKVEFQPQPLTDDPLADYRTNAIDIPLQVGVDAAPLAVPSIGMMDIFESSGQTLQLNPSTGSLGVTYQSNVLDLRAVAENISPLIESVGISNEQQSCNLQILKSAYDKGPQPKYSERAMNYTPQHPAITPASYPQEQALFVNNPAFWEQLGPDTDVLFFSFFYQQNTYQQHLAAKELKRRSWRYHRKYNTWFQQRGAPLITTYDFECGSYVYFDFHVANDGWCQRIKLDFTLLYNYLEDKLNI